MHISTSILNADNRINSVVKLNRTNTSYIHVDVMDGKFVEDTQFKINEINAINMVSKYPLDIHLMVKNPISYIEKLNNMNIEYITIHLEIQKDIKKLIKKIKEMNYKVGISLNPKTDIEEVIPYLKDIDLVLVMSVTPGKGGQKFLKSTIGKVNKLKRIITENNYNVKIEVDGGINDTTISLLENIDIAVVGSYVIKSENYYKQIEKLLRIHPNYNPTNIKINKKIIQYLILFLIVILSLILIARTLNYIK